jgi:hypothetical protein
MKKSLFLFFTLGTLLFACKSDTGGNQSQTETAQPGIAPETVKLICQPVEEPNMEADAPRNEVFLQLGNSKVKIADVLACDVIAPGDYEMHQIPKEALHAVGGWWAGGGDYFYVIVENGNYVVKQGAVDEMQEDNSYGYKTVVTFDMNGKQVM